MFSDWTVAVAAILIAILTVGLTIYVVRVVRKGNESPMDPQVKKNVDPAKLPDDEHKGANGVISTLRRNASLNEYQLVSPVSISGSRGTTDLDAVLVGWFGVLGVKCLGYGGTVYGSEAEDEWVQNIDGGRRTFQNPLRVAEQNVRVLREQLLAKKQKNVPIECVVVFTGKKTQLALPRSTGHYTVKDFSTYLKSSRFDEDKKVDTAAVAAALRGE